MFDLVAVSTAIHALSAVIWVGGMVFAYAVLRPSLGALEPPQRLTLWRNVFERFFVLVWIIVVALPQRVMFWCSAPLAVSRAQECMFTPCI